MRYIIITIFTVILAIIGWNYRSNISNLLKGEKDLPTIPLPPLTEAQKLEAAKAPEGMVYVPEGEFLSGIPKEIKFSEKRPLTAITLKSFYIDRLEVTNKDFAEFAKKNPQWQKSRKDNEFIDRLYLRDFIGPVEYPNGLDNYPVTWVSWHAAKDYCEADGKRLPTYAEWEKAARGTDARVYPWGSSFNGSKANFCDKSCPFYFRNDKFDDGYSGLAPVGSYQQGASPYGVLDLSGNAREWVSDWFVPTSKGYYMNIPRNDPTGPVSGTRKVVRGGGFQDSDADSGTALYLFGAFDPVKSMPDVGFRCAADVK